MDEFISVFVSLYLSSLSFLLFLFLFLFIFFKSVVLPLKLVLFVSLPQSSKLMIRARKWRDTTGLQKTNEQISQLSLEWIVFLFNIIDINWLDNSHHLFLIDLHWNCLFLYVFPTYNTFLNTYFLLIGSSFFPNNLCLIECMVFVNQFHLCKFSLFQHKQQKKIH